MKKHTNQTNAEGIICIPPDLYPKILPMTGIVGLENKPPDPTSILHKAASATERSSAKDTTHTPEESAYKTITLAPSPGKARSKSCPALNPHIDPSPGASLLRLSVKKGEYVYARPCDIVMLESCDHLVKVYLLYGDKVKKAVRNNTLKDFLLQLPGKQFVRIGRFCAINIDRLSGGNYNEQSFEFDFRVSIKLKHAIPYTVFNAIGK